MESSHGDAEGLGLIPAATMLTREKTSPPSPRPLASGVAFGAYEIHLGVTTLDAVAGPLTVRHIAPMALEKACGVNV